MVVYDSGNVEKLAKALSDVRSGEANFSWDVDEVTEMRNLIDKYSQFVKRENCDRKAPTRNVVVCPYF
jgi:hypothetical protein